MAISSETKQNFAEFLCFSNDEIDNSVFNLLQNKDKKDFEKYGNAGKICLVKDILRAFSVEIEGKNEAEKALIEAVIDDILKGISTIESPESWDMERIGGAEIAIEYALDQLKIGYCHPYYTIDDESDLFLKDENKMENDPNFDEENGGIPCICDDICAKFMAGKCPFWKKNEEKK